MAPVKVSKAERKALEKADREGRLAEEMLDRRAKRKSDKFAKVSQPRESMIRDKVLSKEVLKVA